MALRVVVLGQLPASLPQQLANLPAELDLSVVGYYANATAAREALTLAPDIALVSAVLDDMGGLAFVRALSPAERPTAVLIASAREEDAVQAFELEVTDFVSVPVVPKRLADAFARARQQLLQVALLRTADELQRLIGQASASGLPDLGALFARTPALTPASTPAPTEPLPTGSGSRGHGAATGTLIPSVPWRPAHRSAPVRTLGGGEALPEAVLDLAQDDGGRATPGNGDAPPLRVLVREGRRTRFVPLSEVDWFEADGNYIVVHATGASYRTRGTITAIESALDPRQFVRIHRRMVVNMDRVREMTPLPGGDGLLLLGDGVTLRLSRTYRSRVR
jgi:two-component system LytT family response regulator